MELYKHQQNLLNLNPKKYLLAWEVGTGKSLAGIELAKKNGQIPLILCPKSIKIQWQEQIPADWLVLTKEEFKKQWSKLPKYNCLLIDEAHYFSNYKSQLTKLLLAYIKHHDPEYVYCLTATPYLSSPWNIYSLALIFGKDWKWWKFKNYFFYDVRMGSRIVPMVKTLIDGVSVKKVVAKWVNYLGKTVKMEECVDIPEQVYEIEYFKLTTEQKKAIETIDDIMPIVRWTKIHQICGGTLKGDGYTKDQFFKSEKFNRLQDLVNEHKKLIVICRYNNEIDFLFDNLKTDKPIYRIRGDIKNRHEVVEWSEVNKECIVIIQGSCSEGYELPSFPIMVFYSYDFSLKNYIQIKGRIQRINNIKKNVYFSLVVKGTIDEDVFKCIQRKEDFDIEIYERTRLSK